MSLRPRPVKNLPFTGKAILPQGLKEAFWIIYMMILEIVLNYIYLIFNVYKCKLSNGRDALQRP